MSGTEPLVCIDRHGERLLGRDATSEGCSGTVEYRMPLSPSGKPFPRCDRHWSLRLDKEEEIRTRYPDSPTPPSDFDPSYAGEVWDDTDY